MAEMSVITSTACVVITEGFTDWVDVYDEDDGVNDDDEDDVDDNGSGGGGDVGKEVGVTGGARAGSEAPDATE